MPGAISRPRCIGAINTLHTSISVDAGAIGCIVDDEAGYRFSRGEEITTSTGQRIKLSRPMDWVVISDHAEAYGGIVELLKGNPTLLADPTLRRWHDMIKAGARTRSPPPGRSSGQIRKTRFRPRGGIER